MSTRATFIIVARSTPRMLPIIGLKAFIKSLGRKAGLRVTTIRERRATTRKMEVAA
jgi:hypothetical protein